MPVVGVQGSAYPYLTNRGITPGRRFIQRGDSAVYHQTWGNAVQPSGAAVAATTAVVDNILTGILGPNTATLTLTPNGTTGSANGVVVAGGVATLNAAYGPWTGSRNVVVTVTHATSIVAVSGTITGIDVYGRVIAENWSVTATGTSKTYATKKAFKYVTQITITAASDASADTVKVGDGVVFGLDVRASAAQGISGGLAGLALKEIVDSALVTTGTIIPFDPTNSGLSASFSADMRGTYAPSAAPNASHLYDIWFITDDPEYSDALG